MLSSVDEIIRIEIPEKQRGESLEELAEFIEEQLRPPSRTQWLLIYFAVGVMGGVGLGVFIGWLWVK